MDLRIIRVRYEYLRNEAHVAYHQSVEKIFAVHPPERLSVVPLYNIYREAYRKEVSVLDIIRKSELTADIEEQDRKRDAIYRGFADTVKGATNHFDTDKREAALKLNNVIVHYGNMAAKPLDEETAAIDDLVRELNDSCPSEIAALALDGWVARLSAENDAFKTLISNRYTEMALRPDVRMKTARKATDAAFRPLLNQIEALVLVNGLHGYDAFIRQLNAVSERYKHILAQEAGQRASHHSSH